jgi:hypothetical protein
MYMTLIIQIAGDFLCNSESERRKLKVKERTHSVFRTYLCRSDVRARLTNPLFSTVRRSGRLGAISVQVRTVEKTYLVRVKSYAHTSPSPCSPSVSQRTLFKTHSLYPPGLFKLLAPPTICKNKQKREQSRHQPGVWKRCVYSSI